MVWVYQIFYLIAFHFFFLILFFKNIVLGKISANNPVAQNPDF